jgi:REP element-mobilizing transposase RayT
MDFKKWKMNNIPHRHSIRLKGYDYSQAGLYFVTIGCQDRNCRFGKIEKGEMILNESGRIAYDEWVMLPERYSCVTLDVFQIMPNHIHGIIALNTTAAVGATLAVALNAANRATANGAMIANRAIARVAPTQ